VVIVPSGAKGGFVLRDPPEDPDKRRELAKRAYEMFIGSMLELTDNHIDGKNIPPDHVTCLDAPDPYLVVAADKGTAQYSDVANALAEKRHFWLGDAFASGGSVGYDHKRTGITARSAWVSTMRHFRELGIDPERDTISVLGIGDMSGDVFGNGMLLSEVIHLVAAFDHRHIFLDPARKTSAAIEASFKERQRLFNTPHSSWDDYDRSLLGAGGGIYPRDAKAIPLSPQVRSLLGPGLKALFSDTSEPAETEDRVASDTLLTSGPALIRGLLSMPVDLIWNGGIGTYVRSSRERNSDAADRANDNVRIVASELRARVVAEGGNLGLTPKARVDAALFGVRLNSDAIDNCGGVCLSDYEVNLKLLLAGRLERGDMSPDERNRWLSELEEQACDYVLATARSQTRMLSLEHLRSLKDPNGIASSIRWIEEHLEVRLDDVNLPGKVVPRERATLEQTLTRPEIALIAARVKMILSEILRDDEEVTPDVLEPFVLSYFSETLREKFRDDILHHSLARETGLRVLLGKVLDSAGVALVAELIDAFYVSEWRVLRAYLNVSALSGAWALKDWLIENVSDLNQQYRALLWIEQGLFEGTAWLIANGSPSNPDKLTAEVIKVMRYAVKHGSHLRTSERQAFGLPEEQELDVAAFAHLTDALQSIGIWNRAGDKDNPPGDPTAVWEALVDVASRSGLQMLIEPPREPPFARRFERAAHMKLRCQLRARLSRLMEMDNPDLVRRCSHIVHTLQASPVSVEQLVMIDQRMAVVLGGRR
jgi:glutamate dehydrogenase